MRRMKSILSAATTLMVSASLLMACGGSGDQAEITQLKEETIAVHDEIMPQISSFDRNTVRIDSILLNLDSLKAVNEGLDTAQLRADLTALKSRLEGATDEMMTWMMEFDADPQDMTNEEIKAYYQAELEKVKAMKGLFEEVSKESADKLANY